MRIPIIPSSRFGRAVYATAVALCLLGALARAWGDHKLVQAFADHGAVADVLPFDSYVQHASSTRFSDTKYNEWKSAEMRFRTQDGRLLTISHGIGDEEIATLKAGGTLHMQYLPEDPQGSAHLEGHAKKPWQSVVLAAVLALYFWLLVTPETTVLQRRPVPPAADGGDRRSSRRDGGQGTDRPRR
jgi:hypothetical protein